MATEGVAREVVARGVAAVGDECQCQSLHCKVYWRRGGIRSGNGKEEGVQYE